MRADESGCCHGRSVWDGIVFEEERLFGDEGFDGRIEGDRHLLEGVECDVSFEVVLDVPGRYSHLLGEFGLCHLPLVEDEYDVFFDIHTA